MVAGIATAQGWVEYLEWLYTLTKGKCFFSCIKAAANIEDWVTRYRVLMWYQSKPDPPKTFEFDILDMATATKDVKLVQSTWKKCTKSVSFEPQRQKFFDDCARSGDPDLIVFRAICWPPSSYLHAEMEGMIQFKGHGIPVWLHGNILDYVAISGNVDTARKLVKDGFKFSSYGVSYAIESMSIDMLKLAVANAKRTPGRPSTGLIPIYSSWARMGTMEQLTILGEPNPKHLKYEIILGAAASSSNIVTFDWTYARRQGDLTKLATKCIEGKALRGICSSESKAIRFLENLTKKYKFVPTQDLAETASKLGKFKVLTWIVNNQYPYDNEKCMKGLGEYYSALISGAPTLAIKRTRIEEELSKRDIKMRRLNADEMDK